MYSRIGCLFLILIGIILTLRLQSSTIGHDTTQRGVMAFFDGGGQPVVVLSGDMMHPGVYALSDVSDPVRVIKLAGVSAQYLSPHYQEIIRDIPGAIRVGLYTRDGNCFEIVKKNVCNQERILLGLLLQPDNLAEDDWMMLPGIGQVMAKRIVEDRQKNGDFDNFYRLRRVQGVGDAIIARIAPYFQTKH